jgi:heme/copper-type cytochrome/quinol oxidase subunit 4
VDLISKLKTNIGTPIIELLFAFAFLQFLWGMLVFIKNTDNAEAQKNGKSHMLWGVVGLVIMFGVYGILNLMNGTISSLMSGG